MYRTLQSELFATTFGKLRDALKIPLL